MPESLYVPNPMPVQNDWGNAPAQGYGQEAAYQKLMFTQSSGSGTAGAISVANGAIANLADGSSTSFQVTSFTIPYGKMYNTLLLVVDVEQTCAIKWRARFRDGSGPWISSGKWNGAVTSGRYAVATDNTSSFTGWQTATLTVSAGGTFQRFFLVLNDATNGIPYCHEYELWVSNASGSTLNLSATVWGF